MNNNYAGCGAEYVNILYEAVELNLSVPHKFVCFTDNPDGIECETRPIQGNGWFAKLFLFKEFTEGRVIFLDLDTVITGNIDHLAEYTGDFALLRDFYKPDGYGSGVMLWRGGYGHQITDSFIADGQPEIEGGDQVYIESMVRADYVQDLFPEKIISYKAHATLGIPPKTSIVCFHGLPRPHQVDGWVKLFWKKDPYATTDFEVICNTELTKVKENIRYSSSLDLPWLEIKPATDRKIVLCGGAPSLKDSLGEIRDLQQEGALIVGLNGSAEFLVENDIPPDWLVMIDSRVSNAPFVSGYPAQEYFIASQCAPIIFSWLKDEPTTLFHIDIPHVGEYIPGDRPIQAIGGGSTVGLIAMSLAYTQGFRDIHLYGYDSSIREDEGHAYPQEDESDVVEAEVEGRKFKSTPWMITQVNQWQQLSNQLRQLGCNITVHGDGLLPYLAWVKSTQENLLGE
jgi:uncharacterized Rossmann fold enzyme